MFPLKVYLNSSKSKQKPHAFFISNTRLKLAKHQAKAAQHPETERLLSENYSLSSCTLSSKNNRRDSKKCTKTNVFVLIRLYE